MPTATKRFQPYQSGDGNLQILLDFAYHHTSTLDPAFNPPREKISSQDSEGMQDVMQYKQRWGNDRHGFDTLHQVELEPRASGQVVDQVLVTAYGLPAGHSFELEVKRSWYDPRFAEIRLSGPQSAIDEILSTFEAQFGGTQIDPSKLKLEALSAEVSFKVGAHDAAILKAEAILKVDPEYPKAHFVKGASHLAKGDLAQAETHLEKAHSIDPDHQLTMSNLARLREKQAQPKEALRLYQLILDAPQDSSLRPEFYAAIRESMQKLRESPKD